jgi:alkanesulfonate monooxygenase SsuD/methylene tetrahydromethanopterin reductase-like flavin-dependent oxidoreductase (luciferase family)
MTGEPVDDVTALKAEFPLWRIAERWVQAGSGPDGRVLTARRGAVVLQAPTADGLRRAIRRAGG